MSPTPPTMIYEGARGRSPSAPPPGTAAFRAKVLHAALQTEMGDKCAARRCFRFRQEGCSHCCLKCAARAWAGARKKYIHSRQCNNTSRRNRHEEKQEILYLAAAGGLVGKEEFCKLARTLEAQRPCLYLRWLLQTRAPFYPRGA